MIEKIIFLLCLTLIQADKFKPEQVHIALGNKTNDIVVTWSTFAPTQSLVKYGEETLDKTARGDSVRFQDGNQMMVPQWIHNVVLPGLKFNTRYVYQVGSDKGWYGNFTFKTVSKGHDWKLHVGLYGDLGVTRGDRSITCLTRDVKEHIYDMIFHVGDFAYDFHNENGTLGDRFMNLIEPIAANVPYMTCPGNHEYFNNFTHYKHRFTMPGHRNVSSLYYSFDIGPVHFISMSTEVYMWPKFFDKHVIKNQYQWLRNDLTKANIKENRKLRPWVIMLGHRPMYCSNSGDTCYEKNIPNRIHLEPLLMEFGVDIVLWAHEHSYERTWPVYDYKTYNSSNKDPYINSLAPIHIITGSAGCKEGNDPFINPKPDWSAFHSSDRGYTNFTVYNGSHTYWEQVSTEHEEKIIDGFWIVKDKHGPFNIR